MWLVKASHNPHQDTSQVLVICRVIDNRACYAAPANKSFTKAFPSYDVYRIH